MLLQSCVFQMMSEWSRLDVPVGGLFFLIKVFNALLGEGGLAIYSDGNKKKVQSYLH